MNPSNTILLWLAVFGASFVGTAAMRLIAPQLGWISEPRRDRWHSKPTALAGGLGCFPAFAVGLAYLLFVNFWHKWRLSGRVLLHEPPVLLGVALLGGVTMMFLVGFTDD